MIIDEKDDTYQQGDTGTEGKDKEEGSCNVEADGSTTLIHRLSI
jgi:hypothetical protein